MGPASYHAFCQHIKCEALLLEEGARIIEYCSNCRAYQLYDFLRKLNEIPVKEENDRRGEEAAPGKLAAFSLYKRALQLACEDLKNCRRFCPRYYKMWKCNRPLCPDRESEWTCWALAYLHMAGDPNNTNG